MATEDYGVLFRYQKKRKFSIFRKPRRTRRFFQIFAGILLAVVLAFAVGKILVGRIDILPFSTGRKTSDVPVDARVKDHFAFGKVELVTKRILKITEYDSERKKDVAFRYFVTADTKLVNIDKLANLKPGIDINLVYQFKGKKRKATTVIKRAENKTEHVIDGDITLPINGRLVLSSNFQQIGDNEDSVPLSIAEKMALMTLVPANQPLLDAIARLPASAHEAIAPVIPMELFGIERWLTANELPVEIPVTHKKIFGQHQLCIWDDGNRNTTVALWRADILQFAFKGYRSGTTGNENSAESFDEQLVFFNGPPAGTDLDGDGIPDLLLYDFSGGAHCCYSVKHIICSDPPVFKAQILGTHSEPTYKDLDGDGLYEMMVGDASYAYWNACYADSPQPLVIYRICPGGRYEMAGDLMRLKAFSRDAIEKNVAELRHRLSRIDIWLRKSENTHRPGRKLTEEEEKDDRFFGSSCWSNDHIRIHPFVWDFLLSLIYSGQVEQAVEVLNAIWPKNKPGKEDFAYDLLDMIRSSWHGSRLPWFPLLETAFGAKRKNTSE